MRLLQQKFYFHRNRQKSKEHTEYEPQFTLTKIPQILEKRRNSGLNFGGFGVKSVFMGAKTHSGHCGTVENGQKWGRFLMFFAHFLTYFGAFLPLNFETKQFGN